MKIRDTAFANAARASAGRWLKALREARGLSQSELARELDEPHYTLISQMETGRRSIPTYHVKALARALDVGMSEFARAMLENQDPLMHAAIFGKEDEFDAALDQLMTLEPSTDPNLDDIVVALLSQYSLKMSLSDLQTGAEAHLGRELHYQSVSQALRRLEGAGLVERFDKLWSLKRQRSSSSRTAPPQA